MSIPPSLVEVTDSVQEHEYIFFDSIASVILMVSSREGPFKSVKEYMDCTRQQLETQLKENFEDSTLSLISCDRSLYYPEKSTLVRFHVNKLPMGYTTYSIFFIHHRRKEIQIAFTYKDHPTINIQHYIADVMKTMVLE